MRISVLLIALFFGSQSSTYAQALEIGVGVGVTTYWGDLNAPSNIENFKNSNVAFQINAKYDNSRYFALRAGAMYGKVSGDDSKSTVEWQRTRNLDFSSPIVELSVLGELHFLGNNYLDGLFFSPFVALGGGAFYFDPATTLNGRTYKLQPLGTEGQGMDGFPDKYSKISSALMFGGGARIRINEGVVLVADVIMRKTGTDYLDDVSGNYVSYPELLAGNGPIAAQLGNRMAEYLGQSEPVILETGTQRGGEFVSDYYFSSMLTFYITLGDSGRRRGRVKVDYSKCPKF